MLTRWIWRLRDASRQLWFTVAVYSIVGIVTALSALVLDPLIPTDVSSKIGADAVDRILGILASSMLAVTTFSIATMVQAFASAGSVATPRATQLLVEDRTAQRALATFIGTFVFSLVSIIALSTGAYGPSGRLVLFFVTLCVIALIIVTLLRWIDRLSKLGRVGETVDQVERATTAAIRARRKRPYLGGHPAVEVPAKVYPVFASKVGYVDRIDMGTLGSIAEDSKCEVHVHLLPGGFATPDRAVASLSKAPDDETGKRVGRAFNVGGARSFDQDPRFGLIVLAEVASRALSPAVNDPGTAIDVIGTAVRVLHEWSLPDENGEGDEVEFPGVFVPPLTAQELVQDVFTPVGRDGAGLVEVCIRLQKALRAIAAMPSPGLRAAATRQAQEALERGEAQLTHAHDKERLREAASWMRD
jgi:uncharacterized membrane protein